MTLRALVVATVAVAALLMFGISTVTAQALPQLPQHFASFSLPFSMAMGENDNAVFTAFTNENPCPYIRMDSKGKFGVRDCDGKNVARTAGPDNNKQYTATVNEDGVLRLLENGATYFRLPTRAADTPKPNSMGPGRHLRLWANGTLISYRDADVNAPGTFIWNLNAELDAPSSFASSHCMAADSNQYSPFDCRADTPGYVSRPTIYEQCDGTACELANCCQIEICAADEHVVSNVCTPCPANMTRPAGDDATLDDTSCTYYICPRDMRVKSGECVECQRPETETNEPGDNINNGNTDCDTRLCLENEHVASQACTPCAADGTRPAGDPVTGGDTECAFDCVGEFSVWDACSVTCGNGTQSRTFNEISPASGGGAVCVTTPLTQPCNDGVCPCLVHEHVADGACQPCPTGATRAAGDDPTQGDTECFADCVGEFSVWDACSVTCGDGTQSRTFNETQPAVGGGAACVTTPLTQPCNDGVCLCLENEHVVDGACQPCPTGATRAAGDDPTQGDTECFADCVGEFSVWDACSVTCGDGTQSRTFNETQPAVGSGAACVTTPLTQPCNLGPCPGDCVGEFSAWDPCSAACGDGTQSRTFTELTPANGGAACVSTPLTQPCNNGPCICNENEHVVDGACVACPLNMERPAGDEAANGDTQCTYFICPRDLRVKNGACVPCLKPAQETNAPGDNINDGNTGCDPRCDTDEYVLDGVCTPCPADTSREAGDDVNLGDTACTYSGPDVDCVGDFSAWGACSATCGDGTQSRTFTETTPALGGGAACVSTPLTQACNEGACPVDCAGVFSDYSPCSATCGDGVETRTFTETVPAANGGAECVSTPLSRPCNDGACPAPGDCVGSFTPYSTCSVTCGDGSQTRTFVETTPAVNGGAECITTPLSRPCNDAICPVDCEGTFSDYSVCSTTCGDGIQTRSFTETTPAANGGVACVTTPLTQPCNNGLCPVDCEGDFSAWGACSATCGDGIKVRTFTETVSAAHGGAACVSTPLARPCNDVECPVDCAGVFSDYSPCSATCGDGVETRTFTETVPAANGGAECVSMPLSRPCNDGACPAPGDCVGSFTPYSACSVTCGDGFQTRTFVETTPAEPGGAECVNTPVVRACNSGTCPVDCVGQFTPFSQCSASCGAGIQVRSFIQSVAAAAGGAQCVMTPLTQPCNDRPCSVDCVGSFSDYSSCSATCGNGSQSRTFTVSVPAANGGTECVSTPLSRSCDDGECPGPVDCAGDFSDWGDCSVTCGDGFQTRSFLQSTAASNGGAECVRTPIARACSGAEPCVAADGVGTDPDTTDPGKDPTVLDPNANQGTVDETAPSESNNLPIIAGAAGGAVLCCLVLLVVFMRRKRTPAVGSTNRKRAKEKEKKARDLELQNRRSLSKSNKLRHSVAADEELDGRPSSRASFASVKRASTFKAFADRKNSIASNKDADSGDSSDTTDSDAEPEKTCTMAELNVTIHNESEDSETTSEDEETVEY